LRLAELECGFEPEGFKFMGFKIKRKKNIFSSFRQFDKIDALAEAIDLFNAEKWREAFDAAEKAVKTYPNERRFWEIIAVAGSHLGEIAALQKAFGRLIAFDGNDDEAWFGLAQAYGLDQRIALMVRTFRQFLERFPDDPKARHARETVAAGEKELARILAEFGLPNDEEGLELACLHERAQVLLHQGNYEQAIKKGEELIEKMPRFAPAYNNLSLTFFVADEPEKAVETARRVLEFQPDNFHALGNLTKFSFFLGRRGEAEDYANRLRATASDNPMIYAKKIEALAFLGDDGAVVEVFKDWQKRNVKLTESEGFFKHLAAFSFYQLGKEKEAKKLWQQAAGEDGGDFARVNLDEMLLPEHQRNLFSLPLHQWVSGKLLNELMNSIGKLADDRNFDKKLREKVREFFKKNPNVLALFSNVLERADASGREFVIKLIEWSNMPEALEMLKDFALGRKGSDAMRHRAAMSLAQAGYIPNKIKLWREGEQSEIILLCFEITDEPTEVEGYPLKPKAVQLMGKGVEASHKGNFELARQYYEMALKVQPEHPSLLFNLLVVEQQLGQKIDMAAELESLVARFPNYTFAALSLALRKIDDEKLDEATALTERFHEKKKWHVTEIALWCRFNMRLLLAKEEYEGAKMWFEMLKQFDERNDHSELEKFFEQSELYGNLSKMLKKMEERKAKRKKKK
jgi:tetratricopeptide (TPR) repeat protein